MEQVHNWRGLYLLNYNHPSSWKKVGTQLLEKIQEMTEKACLKIQTSDWNGYKIVQLNIKYRNTKV